MVGKKGGIPISSFDRMKLPCGQVSAGILLEEKGDVDSSYVTEIPGSRALFCDEAVFLVGTLFFFFLRSCSWFFFYLVGGLRPFHSTYNKTSSSFRDWYRFYLVSRALFGTLFSFLYS